MTIKKKIAPLYINRKKKGGRNNEGKITVRHIGGGYKLFIPKIDHKRDLINISGTIIEIHKITNKSAKIALVLYQSGILSYITASETAHVGQRIIATNNVETSNCHSTSLKNILIGSTIHNIENTPGMGGRLVRAAGTGAVLINKTVDGYATIKLPSGEIKKISNQCTATVGKTSNLEHNTIKKQKAGESRNSGVRPTVRGVAMNPVDHPHGGGEGKTSGGRPSVSFTGIYTKGYKTRRNKKTNYTIIRRK